jgi:SNF2 family DNA or RNA helicase
MSAPDRWRHQEAAFRFALEKRGVLLDMFMGTGKSKVAVDLVIARRHQRTLIVCPKKVIDVWPEQFSIHATCSVAVCPLKKGSVESRTSEMNRILNLAQARKQPAVIVINYESAWREPFASAAGRVGFDLLVMDESHRIKAPGGKASRYLARLSRLIPWRMGLTGTMMPHSFLDVYAQYRAIDARVFGTNFNAYKHQYGIFGGFGGYELKGVQNKEELHAKIYSIAYHAGKDVLDLPEEMHITYKCDLTPLARKVYSDLYKNFVAGVQNGTVTVYNALTKLLRLQQCTSGYAKLDDGREVQIDQSKYELMVDTVEDSDAAEPWVIFCKFTHDVEAVHRMAQELGRSSLELSGKSDELEKWQMGEAPILAVQIQAGGLGVDLTRARYCGYYSKGFSLGDYQQSLARVHRPGQKRPVTYYHWIAENSIDEQVEGSLKHKSEVIADILKQAKESKDE